MVDGRTDCIDELARRGADVNSSNQAGVTPLHRAAMWGQCGSIRSLMNAGANAGATTRSHQALPAVTTPVQFAEAYGKLDAVETFKQIGDDTVLIRTHMLPTHAFVSGVLL
jgi:ankyrin repeat protein